MKLFLLTAAVAFLAGASASDSTLRGSSADVDAVEEFYATMNTAVYAPPAAEGDIKTLWDELAAEARLMQVGILEGRTREQCITACRTSNSVNRARCEQNCNQADDNGCSSNVRTFACGDCHRCFPNRGNRQNRCLESCHEDQDRQIDRRDTGCRRDSECPGSQECRDGFCLGSARTGGRCSNNNQCGNREECRNDRCQSIGSSNRNGNNNWCDGTRDCSSGEVCRDNRCERSSSRNGNGNRCTRNSDCGSGDRCRDSYCEPRTAFEINEE